MTTPYDTDGSDDRTYFLKVYKTYYQDLYQYGYRFSRDKEITKDCIQQMFMELWSKEDCFLSVTKLKPYLIKYLQRKLLKEISKKGISYNSIAESINLSEESFESILIKNQQSQELRDSLKTAMLSLTKRQIQIVELRYIEGYSFDEIAQKYGVQHRTVYNQLHTAIKILRENLISSNSFTLLLLSGILT